MDDPLVGDFEGVGGAEVVVMSVVLDAGPWEEVITGASVPDPVTGTMMFDRDSEGDEGPDPESA